MTDDTQVRRSKRWGDQGWVSAPNALVRDSTLSAEARLLYVYVASHDESYVIHFDGLLKAMACGRDRLRRMVRELEAAGWITREQRLAADGRFAGYDYILHPTPENPSPEEPPVASPVPEKAPVYKKTKFQEDQDQEDQPSGGSAVALRSADGLFAAPAAPPRPTTAGAVVAAWVEAAGTPSTASLRARVGKIAKELLDGGTNPAELVAAARSAGQQGFWQIDQQLLRDRGRSVSRPSGVDAGVERMLRFADQVEGTDPWNSPTSLG